MHHARTTALALVLVACPATALAVPAPRVQITQAGDFLLIGNTQGQDCGPGVPAPVVGTLGACGPLTSDTSPDVSWQSDYPVPGQASADVSIGANKATTAVLSIPAGATVTHAYLYWSVTRYVATIDTSVQVERPGGFLVTASSINTATAQLGGSFFSQSVADVTPLVQAQGSGAYRVSGIESAKLSNLNQDVLFAGWWMVVLYQKAGLQVRHLAIYDGLDLVQPGAPVSVTDSGFTIPQSAVAGKLGVIGFDGDDQVTGDQLTVNGISLSDAQNPVQNFFNSTRSTLGAAVSVAGDLPQLTGGPRSMNQIDLDVVSIAGATAPGQSAATIQASTSNDVFLLGGLVTSIATVQPDLSTSTKTALDFNGGGALPGDVIQYAITVTNTGEDTAVGTVVTDPLPLGVTFVPGSIQVTTGPNGGAKSDVSGDDQAEYDPLARTVEVRLGGGANAVMGGSLAPGASSTVVFEVTIDPGASGTIANQASLSAAGQLGSPAQSFPSDGNGPAPGAPPTTILVNPALDSDGDGLTDLEEFAAGTDPYDADSDDDGVADGQEPQWNVDSDGDGLINALDPDSDGDGLFDGTELGKNCNGPSTDVTKGHCVPDADAGATTTNPLNADTDFGGVSDGIEDTNQDGAIEAGERDPNNPADDFFGTTSSASSAVSASSTSVGTSTGTGAGGMGGAGGAGGSGGQGGATSSGSSSGSASVTSATSSGVGGAGGHGGAGTATSSGSATSSGIGGAGGLGGAGGMTSSGSGSVQPDVGVVQGGCLCSAAGSSEEAPLGALFLPAAAVMAAARRRRRR